MIKQALRYLLDVLEAKDTPAASQGVDDLDAVRAAPRSNPVAPGPATCFVVDASDADFLQIRAVMDSAQATAVRVSAASLQHAVSTEAPSIIFVGVPEGGESAARAMLMNLAAAAFGGSVQLVGATPNIIVEPFAAASSRTLRTLEPLVSPLGRNALEDIVKSEGLARTADGAIAVDLGIALARHWIEFWYQPKIDFKKRTLVGAESLARLRHPTHGVLLPSSFLPDAATPDLARLGIQALKAAFRDWVAFDRARFNLRLAVNIPIDALDADQIIGLIEAQQLAPKWPGLVFDIEEQDVRRIKPDTRDLLDRLRSHCIDIAVDNVGVDPSALASLVTLPVSEIKLARSLVHHLTASQSRQTIARLLIDLAHRLGALAVANGIETATDAKVLQDLGCDLGQGQFFAPALPRAQFVALLTRRPAQPGAAG